MLRLTQTEEFKTIISSCSTKEQEQKASIGELYEDNHCSMWCRRRYHLFVPYSPLYSFSFTNFASGVSDGRKGEKMCRNYFVSLTRS